MSVYSYFTDNIIRPIFPDIKRIRSVRANAVLLYSEQLGQLIYIRDSKKKQPLKKALMRQYHERSMRDIRRLMIKKYGKKQGILRYNKSDKLDIIIVDRTCKNIYRLLWALNQLKEEASFSPLTYNRKTYHMVFDREKKGNREIAATIYKALYKRIGYQLESIETGLRKKQKEQKIKPFHELKTQMDAMRFTSYKLQSKYYELMGNRLTCVKPELQAQIDCEIENIRGAKIIKVNHENLSHETIREVEMYS